MHAEANSSYLSGDPLLQVRLLNLLQIRASSDELLVDVDMRDSTLTVQLSDVALDLG